MLTTNRRPGELLRDWRTRRRMSQLDLACEADISSKHLSFVETGRSSPSREMILHLCETLDVPLRERNRVLVAGGFAPAYPGRSLADPALDVARTAVERVLAGHEPFPAIAIDRHWTLVSANSAIGLFLESVDPALLEPPVNVLRLSLDPRGLAPRIVNLAEWRDHLFARLEAQIAATADPALETLLAELRALPAPAGHADVPPPGGHSDVFVPLQLAGPGGIMSFLSTTTVFGTPIDITLSELAIEAFFPADPATAAALQAMAADAG